MTREPAARLATAFLTLVIFLLAVLLVLPTLAATAGSGLP